MHKTITTGSPHTLTKRAERLRHDIHGLATLGLFHLGELIEVRDLRRAWIGVSPRRINRKSSNKSAVDW